MADDLNEALSGTPSGNMPSLDHMNNEQRIILTGASDGIGRALARAYGNRRARLVLVARRAEVLEQVARDVKASGGDALTLAVDVAKPGASEQALSLAERHFGGLDMVILNAGRGGPMFVDGFDVDEVERVMTINYNAIVRMIGAVLPGMLARRRGQIVAIGSLAAYRGMPGSGHYNASKAAVTILMEGLRTELRGSGVDLTTIAPGFVRTAMTAQNEFAMPWLMDPETAARRIVVAIDRRRSEYRFPLPASLAVRLLQLLPNILFDGFIRWGRRSMLKRRP
jgi:short-subunit dehydrogenase